MPNTTYTNLSEVNDLQKGIMIFIEKWVHEKKTPIPLKEIIGCMESESKIKSYTTIKALNELLKKGYIRRAYTISNKTFFVQLRRV